MAGTLLLLVPTHSVAESGTTGSASSSGRKCVPKPVRFLDWRKGGPWPEHCCCWFPRIQSQNLEQQVALPALAESAYQNLSAFFATGFDMMANGAPEAARTSVVSSS